MWAAERRRRRVAKLSEQGQERLEAEEFDAALAIASELEELGWSGGFELRAQALAGKGQLEEAVRVLEAGVAASPGAWLNWQLLGNYRSDLGLHDAARAAYERALDVPSVSIASVRFNQAVLECRCGQHEAGLALLDSISDGEVALRGAALRVTALASLGRVSEALATGERALELPPAEEDDGSVLARIAAEVARLRLDAGTDKALVRQFVLEQLRRFEVRPDPRLLELVRVIDARRAPDSRRYVVLVQGRFRFEARRQTMAFMMTCGVVASSVAQALASIVELEGHCSDGLEVEEATPHEACPDELQGVLSRTGRIFYGKYEEYRD